MTVQSYVVSTLRNSEKKQKNKEGFNILLHLGGVTHRHLGLGQPGMYMLGTAIVIFMTF